KGYVINLGDAGVEIVVEGFESKITSFIEILKKESPVVSEVKNVKIVFKPFKDRFKEFTIEKSRNKDTVASGIFPPDIGICEECAKDMEREGSRWFNYAFTACASCGPRFTGIYQLPYDRERSHMKDFPLCEHCKREYRDPMDRRFDAQGITCSICGPQMSLYDAQGVKTQTDDVFSAAANLLNLGYIVAIKGIGGIHLATLADDDEVIRKLRTRKKRPSQPFALMSPNLEEVRKFAYLNRLEEKILTSWRRPIVLLRKKRSSLISDLIAPGLDKIGVMLPYSGIHLALFKRIKTSALIMTSANPPGLPMIIRNDYAFKYLHGVADYFLLHNRVIVNRCDDSVLNIILNKPSFLRRSRGFVPDPIDIPIKKGSALALGAELRNSAAVAANGRCYLTQYLGDITTLESREFETEAINYLKNLLNITCNPDVIGCDLHPGYMTSQLAEEISQETGVKLIKSQHHHAHISSVSCENMLGLDEEVIGIALDGAGYGSDGAIWGGEVIKSSYKFFKRVGHLEYLPMPGGDLCAYYPSRMLVSALTNILDDDEIRDITGNHVKLNLPYGEKELEVILKQARKTETIKTSSAGRFLDSIAALTEICYKRTYEGEPAILLEALAKKSSKEELSFEVEIEKINGLYVLKSSKFLHDLIKMKNNTKNQVLAYYGQKYLVNGFAEIASTIAFEEGIDKICLSGGVFANEYILKELWRLLSARGFKVLFNTMVPPGDGGTALGQAIISLANVI
ncbi:carbamoyltransferase HypF, partial [Candidatus Bathyarchaeota archaeon]|nr:carbamoyltransferase HypF [Candidatus Bathyarchaeota archaeon]